MTREITSKNMDGITDLVVVAPIREGFIDAYENVTYATRLQLVAEALNRVRVAAREHETITPFPDVTERILTLLDFRIGVIDNDLFALEVESQAGRIAEAAGVAAPASIRSRRYLYLTATFDGAWEPYMRLIWDPLGPFLDLLFCNCDGYVTASEHSFEEYSQWVRDHQVDSAIFYAVTGLTVRDQLYLNRLEQLLRSTPPAQGDRQLAGLTMPDPDAAAKAERMVPGQVRKVHEMALEALTVLYRLADYYPPEWMAGQKLREGRYLVKVAESLLQGWDDLVPRPPLPDSWKVVEKVYAEPLAWYRTGRAHLQRIEAERERQRPRDPLFDPTEIQGGVLKPEGNVDQPMRQGALLLITIADAGQARRFLRGLLEKEDIHFQAGPGEKREGGFFRTVSLTASGLRRLGVEQDVLDWFPKEFREGMEMRSGLIGDVREHHPRRWKLPPRNWPPRSPGAGVPSGFRPPIETSEIDLVLQVRTASADPQVLLAEIERLARDAEPGAVVQGYELLCAEYTANGLFIDHFGFHDGISQPRPTERASQDGEPASERIAYREEVRLGEVLLGYRNDRDDFAPVDFVHPEHPDWRKKNRQEALDFQFNGTFLVIRKLQQEVERFDQFIAAQTARINREHPGRPMPMTESRLKALMLGREPTGKPLIKSASGLNDFTYEGDPEGLQCPLAAHIRRTNPRDSFQGRRASRILRRGMSFDHRPEGGGRGLMFMAYNASIAEQYETIQRWINGGNSTYVGSGHNEPIMGIGPKTGALHKAQRVFRFVEGDQVIRVAMPEPFVSLHWGLYLFVPSRAALQKLVGLNTSYRPLREPLETRGLSVIARLESINDRKTQGWEWKRLLEDFDAKDPSQRDVTLDVWSAIRWYYGGSFKVSRGVPFYRSAELKAWQHLPGADGQAVVLSASYKHVMRVLSDWKVFSTEEQLRRIDALGIPIFVAQQPDNEYSSPQLRGRFDYRKESEATNKLLMGYDQETGFRDGYEAASRVLKRAKDIAWPSGSGIAGPASAEPTGSSEPPKRFKLELRRQYLLPALEELCKIWYGVPDGVTFHGGPWSWHPPAERTPPGARCPGDFLSPSRYTFYPRPTATVKAFAEGHGQAVHEASLAFVDRYRKDPTGLGSISRHMFEMIEDREVLARNIVGTMIGAIPPMDGNLRGILLEWLVGKTLWRHQAALRRALGDRPAFADVRAACRVLYGPVSQAMCMRPAPDLLYRTATRETTLPAGRHDSASGGARDVHVAEGDLVIISLVSAAQRSLEHYADGDVSLVFGGKRRSAYQPETDDPEHPVHACPAQHMAIGAIMGILAALLDAGRIQALPASLIVRISDWP
jgi:deferrochelatase/peroxidase EfeB